MGSALAVRTAVLFPSRIGMAEARQPSGQKCPNCNRPGLSVLMLRCRCDAALQTADLW